MLSYARIAAVILFFFAGCVLAAGDEAAAIKKVIESKFPPATVSHVSKTPYFGLYEVLVGDTLVYTDVKVTYLIVGNVIDPNTKVNLSEQKLAKLRAIDWSQLPLDLAIKSVKGNGARRLAIFADADCPYCKKLENDFKSIDNVTIYTFLFPIDTLHPDATRKSRLIWCSADREKAWKDWILGGKLPNGPDNCETPLAKIVALGEKFNIRATPTLVYADGHVVPGALPLAYVEKELNEAEAAAAKKTASADKPADKATSAKH